jgi:hypothetical protein
VNGEIELVGNQFAGRAGGVKIALGERVAIEPGPIEKVGAYLLTPAEGCENRAGGRYPLPRFLNCRR